MKKEMVFRKNIIGEEDVFVLEYFFCESCVELEGFKVKTYGIEVVKKEPEGSCESICIEDISTSKDRVKEILALIIQGDVTPISIKDVVYDLISN